MLLAALALSVSTSWAAGTGTRDQLKTRDQLQTQDRVQDPAACQCVDADGDGICDKCGTCIPQGADADGDGIPNGQDSDYVPPQDGSGKP
jgi:hypothetical protein